MSTQTQSLYAAQAARQLGVSVKALRVYEAHGLLRPQRTSAGYRSYSADDLRMAQDIVTLRQLGLSLAQIGPALNGDAHALDLALAKRAAELSVGHVDLAQADDRLRSLRQRLQGRQGGESAHPASITLSFALPWPWGGEAFTLTLAPLTYLVGPLGSGKTRLAQQLAQALPGVIFLDLAERTAPSATGRFALQASEQAWVTQQLRGLREQGAVDVAPLRVLLSALAAGGGRQAVVMDLVEHGLSGASQAAFGPWLREHACTREAPVVAMTRSSTMLDWANLRAHEAVLYCPANHAPPFKVLPFAGAVGHEAVSLCLASPEVRARLACAPS